MDVDDSSTAGKRGGSEAFNHNTGEMEDGGLGERNGESDETVKALEKGLPKWKGPEVDGRGWTREAYRDHARYQELQGYRVSPFVPHLWLILMVSQW